MCIRITPFLGGHKVQGIDAYGIVWTRIFTGWFSGFRARRFAQNLDTSF